ncbi:hypothetical protein LOK74_19070 [Brevibacillus humidisoli]|uniref:hypothetical protein n=1 Tax=Brevibacillus humidisoli TaxID=2895522 RepID=UPI001E5D49F1|nr:hypothetical protein [Brevibacillus humidisoli]UFJ40116.1 hypothetical protein LOK74_19070 [Brevibacillus humidisoli]
MQTAIAKLFQGARSGITDTQPEFGTIQLHAPLTIKLDRDPEPLEEEECVLLEDEVILSEDIGRKVVLVRCANGQYLVLGKVK